MLPSEFTGIFRQRQKSYKMVLILSLLDEMGDNPHEVSLQKVIERFQRFQAEREERELPVDEAPPYLRKKWKDINPNNLRNLIDNPINALSNIIMADYTNDIIKFLPEIEKQLTPSILKELRLEAKRELEAYYKSKNKALEVNLKELFSEVMNNYRKAKTQSFSGHPLGNLVRHTIPQELMKLDFIEKHSYKVQGSVGMGNWAKVPWIAIMDKRITETTQKGEYIVYLFSEDMKSLYLTFNQGVTVPLQQGRKAGYEYLKNKVGELRRWLPLNYMKKDDQINLTSAGIGREYQVSTIGYIRYDRENLPNDEVLIADLKNFIDNYRLYAERFYNIENSGNDKASNFLNNNFLVKEDDIIIDSPAKLLEFIKTYIVNRGFYFPEGMIENFYLSLKTKPFVILAGISGTGKTKLIQLFAEAIGATEKNGQFTLIPVRPDWSDPADLLGYRDLSGVFKPGRLTQAFWEASQPENSNKPYFICLDEMNLARVEHYSSDLLSIMETRNWEQGKIATDSLLNSGDLRTISSDGVNDNESFSRIEYRTTLGIPQNVYIIGTVNMDETTYPFSKKVLDRAQTLEFNEIRLDTYPEELQKANDLPLSLKNIPNNLLRSDYLFLKDAFPGNEALIKRTTARLVEINKILEEIHAQVGFRVRDNICFYMLYNDSYGLLSEEEAFDFQILQKILPRLQGSHSGLKRVLIELMSITIGQKLNVDEYMDNAAELYDKYKKREDSPAARFPKSTQKIAYMLRRFEEDGFTSFWLS